MTVSLKAETGPGTLSLLAISDVEEELLYGEEARAHFGKVDLVVSCGDLPSSYLDYVGSTLVAPVVGVRGNHYVAPEVLDDEGRPESKRRRHEPAMDDLHARVVSERGLLIAGLEGSRWYNGGPCQYSEEAMRVQVSRLVPSLLLNRARYGRFLDVLVTHAPPRRIHDQEDLCHQGFEAFRWLLRTFRPRYHLHGHCHVYDRTAPRETVYHETTVLNVYGHRSLVAEIPAAGRVGGLQRAMSAAAGRR